MVTITFGGNPTPPAGGTVQPVSPAGGPNWAGLAADIFALVWAWKSGNVAGMIEAIKSLIQHLGLKAGDLAP